MKMHYEEASQGLRRAALACPAKALQACLQSPLCAIIPDVTRLAPLTDVVILTGRVVVI